MNLKQAGEVLREVQENSMGGFVASDIFAKATGMPIVGVNTNSKACALFNNLSEQLIQSIKRSDLPISPNVDQMILQIEGGHILLVIDINEKCRWGAVFDGSKCQLGMIVSVIIPDALPKLRQSLS